MVAVQMAPFAEVQPVHDEKELPLAVKGAVKVAVVPALYVSVKLVFPLLVWLLSAGEAAIDTPLEG